MADTRECSGCGRTFNLAYCKAKARLDRRVRKASTKQTSFRCSCGDVPYRVVSGVEVTSPRHLATAKALERAKEEASAKAVAKAEAEAEKALR